MSTETPFVEVSASHTGYLHHKQEPLMMVRRAVQSEDGQIGTIRLWWHIVQVRKKNTSHGLTWTTFEGGTVTPCNA